MQGEVGVQFVFIDLRRKRLKIHWLQIRLYYELSGEVKQRKGSCEGCRPEFWLAGAGCPPWARVLPLGAEQGDGFRGTQSGYVYLKRTQQGTWRMSVPFPFMVF